MLYFLLGYRGLLYVHDAMVHAEFLGRGLYLYNLKTTDKKLMKR